MATTGVPNRRFERASVVGSLLRRRRHGVDAPIEPVLSEQLNRVLRALRTVAAGQRIGWAVLVAPPAEALGVLWIDGKFLGHSDTSYKFLAHLKIHFT